MPDTATDAHRAKQRASQSGRHAKLLGSDVLRMRREWAEMQARGTSLTMADFVRLTHRRLVDEGLNVRVNTVRDALLGRSWVRVY